MKASGFVELLIIVSALVCGLPLFLACNKMANTDVNTVYMNDKSTWDIGADIEYAMVDGVLTPTNLVDPLKMTAAQAATMPYVQDEFTPNSARTYLYNFDATTTSDTDMTGSYVGDTIKDFKVTIKDNSRATRYGDSNVVRRVIPLGCINASDHSNRVNLPYYLIYNTTEKQWMITNKFIDIYTN